MSEDACGSEHLPLELCHRALSAGCSPCKPCISWTHSNKALATQVNEVFTNVHSIAPAQTSSKRTPGLHVYWKLASAGERPESLQCSGRCTSEDIMSRPSLGVETLCTPATRFCLSDPIICRASSHFTTSSSLSQQRLLLMIRGKRLRLYQRGLGNANRTRTRQAELRI